MDKYNSFLSYFRSYSVYSAVIFIFRFTRAVGDYPILCTDIFMDRKEFEKMFDLVAYERAQKSTMPSTHFLIFMIRYYLHNSQYFVVFT